MGRRISAAGSAHKPCGAERKSHMNYGPSVEETKLYVSVSLREWSLVGFLPRGQILRACLRCFESGKSPLLRFDRLESASFSGFTSSVLHTLAPVDDFRGVAHVNDCLGRDKIEVVHLVAIRAQDYQVGNLVVAAITVDVRDLQNVANAVPAVSAYGGIVIKCELSIIDAVLRGNGLLVFQFELLRVHCKLERVSLTH